MRELLWSFYLGGYFSSIWAIIALFAARSRTVRDFVSPVDVAWTLVALALWPIWPLIGLVVRYFGIKVPEE